MSTKTTVKISIGVIAFGDNFGKFWKGFLQSVRAQTETDWEILVQDNEDGRWQELVRQTCPEVDYQVSAGNAGWGAPHNQMIARARGEFYLFANVTQVWESNFLAEMLQPLARDFRVGSVAPLVLDFAEPEFIDSAGMCLRADLTAVNSCEGRQKSECDLSDCEIFGASGCAALVRRAALEEIKITKDEFLDGQMWMYKEDVELALRLQVAGWRSVLRVAAQTRYHRSGKNRLGTSLLASVKNQSQKNQLVREQSSLNQELIWRKYFLENQRYWSSGTRFKIWRQRFLRHLWENLFDRSVARFRRKNLQKLAAQAEKYRLNLSRGQMRRLENLMKNPCQPLACCLAPADILLSITTVDRVRSADEVARLLNFYKSVLACDFPGQTELIFVLNSVENEHARNFEKEFLKLKCPPQVQLRFARQPHLRAWREVTGYVGAHNWGQNQCAQGRWRLFLNPDVILEKNTFTKLLKFAESEPQLGALAPRMRYADGRVEPIARRFPRLFTQVINRISFLQRIFRQEFERYHMLDADASQPFLADWVCGHCLLVRGDFWRRTGGKDLRFFHFMSDVDLCREVTELGGQVFYNPQITIGNHRPPSSKGGFWTFFRSKMMQIHLRDALVYFWKWR